MSSSRASSGVVYRRHTSVNETGWRFRCPRDHANLEWSSRQWVRCRQCEQGYHPEDIEDKKRDQALEDTMANASGAQSPFLRSRDEETPGLNVRRWT